MLLYFQNHVFDSRTVSKNNLRSNNFLSGSNTVVFFSTESLLCIAARMIRTEIFIKFTNDVGSFAPVLYVTRSHP